MTYVGVSALLHKKSGSVHEDGRILLMHLLFTSIFAPAALFQVGFLNKDLGRSLSQCLLQITTLTAPRLTRFRGFSSPKR